MQRNFSRWINAGSGTAESLTRRRKKIENETGGREGGQWTTSYISLSGWIDWYRKMETMTDIATARKIVDGIINSLPTHRRAVIDEELTYSDLSERVRHLKIIMKVRPGCSESEAWPLRNRTLEIHRAGVTGWPEKLKVQVTVKCRVKKL